MPARSAADAARVSFRLTAKHRLCLIGAEQSIDLRGAFGEGMPETPQKPRIFVLGDSRTGTKALASYFRRAGFLSLHYFMGEAQQIDPPHEHHDENWKRFLAFVEQSPATAFSDYPTRSFYRELFEHFPESRFILTTRRDTATWAASMERFFGSFKIKLDIEELSRHYEQGNASIRELYRGQRAFIEICIDDDTLENSAKLSEFLGVDTKITLARENQTSSLEVSILSRRGDFFGEPVGDVLDHIKRSCLGAKVMPSPSGWLYLINDSNDFIDYAYSLKTWSQEATQIAGQVIERRRQRLAARGIKYLKFIVPEKCIVYPEYLPALIRDRPFAPRRPAQQLADNEAVVYLADYLRDAKSYGPMYFRTDTHPTWLGGFFIYRRIIEEVERSGFRIFGPPTRLEQMIGDLAGYDGDLLMQMREDHRKELEGIWGFYLPQDMRDHAVRYRLPESSRRARRLETPGDYVAMFDTRETYVFERDDEDGPRAVVFRDSTLDFAVDLLAENFSRSVFVWKDGQVFDHVLQREKPDVVIHVMAERFVSAYPTMPALIEAAPDAASATA